VAEDYTLKTVPAIYEKEGGDRHAGIDEAVGSLDALLDLSARDEKEGLGDAPWPPNYRKQEGEPPRVQPSRQKRPDEDYDTPAAEAAREKARVQMERRFERLEADRAAAKAAGKAIGSKPTPTGRRRSSIPVVEIARAAKKDEALAGLDRWKERHADVVPHLRPADILTDSMRGRSTTWTRIRVNLINIPEDIRPEQEPLEVDYDPWSEYEWPDRGGQLERAPKKKSEAKT
jgi:hypothetical protein